MSAREAWHVTRTLRAMELLAELSGGRSAVLVLGADVRIYARALRGALGRLTSRSAPAPPRPEEARVRA